MVDALKNAPDRGHHPRRAHRLAVPEELPLHRDRRLLHPGIADGRDRGDVLLRLHLQLGDAARAAAAGRRGGRRRHRGAGEHLPPSRGGPRHHRGVGGGHRQPRGDLRGDRGQLLAGGDLRAGGLRERHPRPVPALVRGGGDLRRAGVAVRFADPHADAVLALPRRAGEARPRVLGARARVPGASTAPTGACSAGRCATAWSCWSSPRPRSSPPCRCSRPCRASWRRKPTKAGSWSASARRSAPRSTTPKASCARSRRSPRTIPRSSPSSASSASGSAQQVNQATLVVRMKPRGERERSQRDVIDAFRRDLAQIAGARAFPRAFGLVQRPALRAAAVRGEGAEPAGDGSARRRAADARCRPTRRSGAWTPTCSSTCRS